MSSPLVLDTTAYAAFKRGHEGVLDAIRRASVVMVPAVVLGELLAGFAASRKQSRNERELEEFLASPRVRVAAIGPDTARRYASIRDSLRRQGTELATAQLWIAAVTMECGGELLTLDPAFERVSQVLVRIPSS